MADTPPNTVPAKCLDGDLSADLLYAGDIRVAGSTRAVGVNGNNVFVGGDVDGTRLTSRGTLAVGGGIVGGPTGRCMVGAALACRAATDVTLLVGGDVTVSQGLTNARVCSGGVVRVDGAIRGGKVAANTDLFCGTVGSPEATATNLAVGIDLYLQAAVARSRPDIDRDRTLAASTRKQIQPLLGKLKSLSPQQRESVTVTLYEADQLDQAVAVATDELRAAFKASRKRAGDRIHVSQTLFPNTTVRVGGVTSLVSDPVQGPVILTAVCRDGVHYLAITNTDTRAETLITATSVDNPFAAMEAFFTAPATTAIAATGA